MKNTTVQIKALSGLYEKLPQAQDGATELINWTVDKYTGGWDNRIGYERYNPIPSGDFLPFSTGSVTTATNKIDSLFVFSRHQGAMQSVLLESGGTLYQLDETYGSSFRLYPISTNRTLPAANEAPTQYTTYGKYLIVSNGYDKSFKYAAWPVHRHPITFTPYLYDLGWNTVPSAPNPWDVALFVSSTVLTGQAVSIPFPFTAINGYTYNGEGLGTNTTATSDTNRYKYRVSFINNAGAESPLSEESRIITWVTEPPAAPLGQNKYAIYIEIPTGPEGTVARRLYRTKNFGTAAVGTEFDFYFVKDINNNTEKSVYDSIPDGALGSLAPDETASILFPATRTRFSAVYKDCLFVEGGADNDTMLFYSKPTLPDQYEATSFIELGNRNSGGITGLHPYFNFLLVFRERGIDAIMGDYPNFTAVPISTEVGTRATNTVTNVPGVGLMFLASDGIYALSSNMEYSDSPGIKQISRHMLKTMNRINEDSLAKACAIYSPKWQEWHCYYPADGNSSSTSPLGVIYHVEKNAFSTRTEFPVTSLARDYIGNIFFGSTNEGNVQPGVFVISKKRANGEQKSGDTIVDKAPPVSTFRSPWMDMGDETIKKHVHFVYLYVLTQGDNPISIEYFKDFYYSGIVADGRKLQRADHNDQSVYNTAQVITGSDKPWEEPLATAIRYPVAQGSCSHFQFKINTENDMVLIGYAVEFTTAGTKMIAGKKT
tara:strand:- start:4967 stop:7111 length:2145 start_codon:yes stop_codon:yes gene_type:complete